jgi:hypothetical protein
MKRILVFLCVALVMLGWHIKQMFDRATPLTRQDGGEEVVEESPYAPSPEVLSHIASKASLIVVESPAPGAQIRSPLVVQGKARGAWFFEASFPVVLTNWDGLIVAEGVATAQGDWMTEAFVPFLATLEFVNPRTADDPAFMQNGALILQKDNPSGLPENDDALEIPIRF